MLNRNKKPRKPGVSGAVALLTGCLTVWMTIAAQGALAGSFQVSPSRFEFSIDKRFTNFFTITNNSTDPVRIRIYPKFIDFDEDGKSIEKSEHPFYLGKWLVFNPRQVSLRPRQKRVIRFSVRPPPNLSPGEYRTVVFFEELPSQQKSIDEKQDNQGGVKLSLSLLARLGVTLYGTVGERTHAVALENESVDMTPDRLSYRAQIANQGNGHEIMDVNIELFTESMDPVAAKKSLLALHRDKRYNLKFDIARPDPGRYLLVLTGKTKERNLIEHSIPVLVGAQPSN